MLLNEFIKEHKKVDEQQASISQLKSEMQTMVASSKSRPLKSKKVSAQLEVSKPAPQVVANNRKAAKLKRPGLSKAPRRIELEDVRPSCERLSCCD